MAAPQMFAGLKALAARAGIKIGATDLPNSVDTTEEDDDTTEEDDTTAPADPADPAGDEGEGEGEGGDEGEGDEAPSADPAPTQAVQKPAKRSAEFKQGERYGRAQEAGRFAAVLASPVCRANLEMATDLLATSSMSPQAIIEHCDRYKGEASAKRLLDTTPKVNLGVETPKTKADDAAKSRKASVDAQNSRQARESGRQGATVRKSRRAASAAAGK